jgi:hypothetical protein
MESWILGCYKNYLEQIRNCNEKEIIILNKWWIGCLKKYYKEKYTN